MDFKKKNRLGVSLKKEILKKIKAASKYVSLYFFGSLHSMDLFTFLAQSFNSVAVTLSNL